MAWKDDFKRYDTSNGYGNAKKWRSSFYNRISDQEAAEIMAAQDESPYSILGISENATQSEIKRAFRSKITEWHPDLNQHREVEATAISKKIIAAYTILTKK